MKKIFFAFAAVALLMPLCVFRARACTGLYIGKKCAADGYVMIGRSCDDSMDPQLPFLSIKESVKGVPGRMVGGTNGFRWELPQNTCRLVELEYPDFGDGYWSSGQMNEYGVAIISTITAYNCKEVQEADPSVPDGVAEETIHQVLAPVCRTAREAVELLAHVLDIKGAAGREIIMVTDQKETWYMEIYSGHQYCAVRLPEDMVAVFGNEFMLDTVDPKDRAGVICSRNLFRLPSKYGFAVMDSNGKMNLRRTYCGDGRFYDFSHLRTWQGHRLLSPSSIGDYEHGTYYPLLFRPDGKVTLEQAMEILRDRYWGTKYNPEDNDAWQNRVIGDETQQDVTIIQVRDDLPAPMCCVSWVTLSEAAHSPYVPVSSAITACNESYGLCAREWRYNPEQAQHIYKRINAFCAQNRKIYSKGVKDYWKTVERLVMKEYPRIVEKAAKAYANNPAEAADILTRYCTAVQDKCIEDARWIFDDMIWHMMKTTKTNYYRADFQSLENHPLPQPPYVVPLDAAKYDRGEW